MNQGITRPLKILLLAALLAGCASSPTSRTPPPIAPTVLGVTSPHLDPEFWIERQRDASHLLFSSSDIADQNRRLVRNDSSLHDIEHLPATLSAARVKTWIDRISARPSRPLYDEEGELITSAALDALVANAGTDHIPSTQSLRYGLIVRRADLRTFPTRQRVFSKPDDLDIDRFQESALFPGTPVAIVHASRDGDWYFVVSFSYAAWVEKTSVAEGTAAQVFGYTSKSPFLVVTGDKLHTVFTREEPAVSELQLDMGVRVPLFAGWPGHKAVNGQHPYTSHIIELPIRSADGSLRIVPALLPRTADVAKGHLPLTTDALLRQSFKFLGERYGWGHSHNARDCSGFVADVYRSFGIDMPRNTGDQANSPVFRRRAFTEHDDHAARLYALRELQVGDLIYIPGHVMMMIGRDRGAPFVIHDVADISYRDGDTVVRERVNGVAVTPLLPLLIDGTPLIDNIISIQRMHR